MQTFSARRLNIVPNKVAPKKLVSTVQISIGEIIAEGSKASLNHTCI